MKRELNRLPPGVSSIHRDALDTTNPDQLANPEFLNKFQTWTQIRAMSEDNSELVLEFLLKCKEHDIARKWVEVFHYCDFKPVIEEDCVFYHLEQNSPNLIVVMEILERMRRENSQDCKIICQRLTHRLSRKKYSLLLVEFLKKHLQGVMNVEEKIHLHLQYIGCLCVLTLPPGVQSEYQHLIGAPVLILEQLLMNMKVDFSGKVLKCIQNELKKLETLPSNATQEANDGDGKRARFFLESQSESDTIVEHPDEDDEVGEVRGSLDDREAVSAEVLQGLSIDMTVCNELLVTYARKALEFGVVLADDSGMATGRLSVASRMSSPSLSSLTLRRRFNMTPRSYGTPTALKKLHKVSLLCITFDTVILFKLINIVIHLAVHRNKLNFILKKK